MVGDTSCGRVFPADRDLSFSIIIPLEFHRGQAEKCLGAWVHGQTYPRHLFEVIAVAPADFPAHELQVIRGLLDARDRLLIEEYDHDMPLCVAGAAAAQGEALFFTESHCWPEADVLARSAEALRDHPAWAGFSCGTVRETHNRLSVLEADMYETDIVHGMTRHAWRKILDQCFVTRRGPYFEAGGFDPSLGHFAEWLLAARYFQLGFQMGYLPEARVHHHYIGDVNEWETFTEDFVRGEIRYLRRVEQEPDAAAKLFEPVSEWIGRRDWNAGLAREMVRAVWQDFLVVERDKTRFKTVLKNHWRLAVRWIPAAITGLGWERFISNLKCTFLRASLLWHARFSGPEVLNAATHRFMVGMVHLKRIECLETLDEGKGISVDAESDSGEWNPGKPSPVRALGFHIPEELLSQPCCWSQPAAVVDLPVPDGSYEIMVQWLPVRPDDQPACPRFYFSGCRLEQSRVAELSARFYVRAAREGGLKLAWTCLPYAARGDSRELGLLIRRVVWRKVRENGGRRPLLMLHGRKNAGTSMRDLISNRFPLEQCLFQAHARANAGVDPTRYSFVTGHVDFGYVSRFAKRPVLMTVLREPLDRALSTYYFFRENGAELLRHLERELPPDEFQERRQFSELANQKSFLEFLETEPALARRHLGNTMVRALLQRPSAEILQASHLHEATGNLASCEVIGLFERLPDTAEMLQKAMAWEGLGPVPHLNATNSRRRGDEEDPRVLQILTQWNDLDLQLYAGAARLFEERLQRLRRQAVAPPANISLPDARSYTFDQPVHGYGWHAREKHGDRWICWMGGDDHAWIDLGLDGPAHGHLACRVAHAISAQALESLSLLVNGEPVAITRREDSGAVMIEAWIGAALLYNYSDRVRITFAVSGRLRPRDLDPSNPDRRMLGIALESLSLRPIA